MSGWGLDAAFIAGLDTATFFPSLCTIQVTSGAQDVDSGNWVQAYSNLTAHVNIACRVGPLVIDRPSTEVSRREGQEIRYKDLHALLQGYYPLVRMTMYALIDGYRYRIDNIQHDGNHLTTRFRIQNSTSVNPE